MGNDIDLALSQLNVGELEREQSFIFYYFACEKMAKIAYGIAFEKAKNKLFGSNKPLNIRHTKNSVKKVGLNISKIEIDQLFSYDLKNSARVIRNKIVHEIGPSHVNEMKENGQRLLPIFQKFLGEWPTLKGYLVDSRSKRSIES